MIALRTILRSSALAAFLQANLVLTSPVRLELEMRQARQDISLLSQVSSWSNIHSPAQDDRDPVGERPFSLPPVSEVFKMVATAEAGHSDTAAMAAPQVLVPAPLPATVPVQKNTATPTPTNTYAHTSTPTHMYIGPGLVIVPTPIIAGPSELSVDDVPASAPAPTQPTISATTNAHRSTAPAKKLIVIGAVMAGLIVLMFLVYLFFNRRCSKKRPEEETWTKIDSPPPPGTYEGSQKQTDYTTPVPWTPSSLPSRQRGQVPTTNLAAAQAESSSPPEDKVIDIGPNYPRSKFSVTSSEYPNSVSTSAYSAESMAISGSPEHSASSPLLPAYEFFCLPSRPESLEDNRHSRAQSAPIFGQPDENNNHLSAGFLRSGEHRKSRSVSGLAYTVKPNERRDSGLSLGDWKGSPESDHGWPSVL